MNQYDTIPKLIRRNKDLFGNSIAEREKDYGIWKTYTWNEVYDRVRNLALGLISLGMQKGDRVMIVGQSEPELYWSEFATICAGGIATAFYPDCTPSEIEFLATDSQASFALCEDQEQVDKFLELKDKLPFLKKIVFWDPKGMWLYDDPLLLSFQDLIDLGKKYDQEHPDVYDKITDEIKATDDSVIIYTSGTTGNPKGSLWSHNTMLDNATRYFLRFPHLIRPGGEYLTFLSLAWSADQGIGAALGLLVPLVVNFPEEPETVTENIREVAPEILFVGPMQWEGFYKMVESRMLDANWLQRSFYKMFMDIGYAIARRKLDGKDIGLGLKLLKPIAEGLVLRQIKDRLGLIHLKLGFTAGTSISPDMFFFFHALGVELRQAYGSTEAGWLAIHDKFIDRDTTGTVFYADKRFGNPLEVRIAGDTEVIARGGTPFRGYYGKLDKISEKVDSNGWYHMGDAGYIRDDGEVIILDRLEDMRKLSDGTSFSPQFIEVRLRSNAFVNGALAVGDENKPFISVLVDIEPEMTTRWAEQRHIPYTTFPELSQKPEIRELIREQIIKINNLLPPESRIKKFVNLHKPFDADEGEMTRSRKIRRFSVEKKYGDIIDSIYRGDQEFVAEAPVRYRDGRTGIVKTEVKINDV